jgi:hypothetical protein
VPRFLALDWAQQRLRLIAASAIRGKVRIEQVLTWEETESLTPTTAETLGQRLRERLRQAHIAPAPLLVVVGRQQVILKEIRYPKSTPTQEPALVRFQAAKELTEPAEQLVMDYVRLEQPGSNSEQRALLLAARKEQVASWKALCRAAGLKLLALTPRAFGLAACLPARSSAAEEGASAILGVTDDWSEFCIARGRALLYARPLPPGQSGTLDEVRRNLALYAGQSQAVPVGALYVAEDRPAALGPLQEALAIPVQPLDPLAGAEPPPAAVAMPAGFAGAAGLVRLWAERGGVPVNFAAPKEPKPETDTGRRKALRVAGLAALGLIGLLFLGNLVLAAKRAEVEALKSELDDVEAVLKSLEPDKERYDKLNEWYKTAVPVVDELYDLTARFPFKDGIRLTSLEIGPMPGSSRSATGRPAVAKAGAGKAKVEYTMRMVLIGQVAAGKSAAVQQLVDAINQDPYCRAQQPKTGPSTKDASGKGPAEQQFTINVDIAPRPPSGYTARLVVPPPFGGIFGGRGRPGFGGQPGGKGWGGIPGWGKMKGKQP